MEPAIAIPLGLAAAIYVFDRRLRADVNTAVRERWTRYRPTREALLPHGVKMRRLRRDIAQLEGESKRAPTAAGDEAAE